MGERSRARNVRQMWARGEAALGAWNALADPFAAELMCAPGVDYVCIDQQHGLNDYPQMLATLRAIEACDVVPLTRVPANEPWLIGKALDAGVQGVIVPMVSSAEDARRAVAACRYKGGVRSYGPIRAALAMGSRDADVLGEEVLCFVMVETRAGLEAVDAIAAVPGLDGIYVGPADLALGLGLPPDLDKEEPEHVAAVARILTACQDARIVAGIQCGSGKAARAQVEAGFRLVTFAKDSSLLAAALERDLRVAKPQAGAERDKGYV